MDRAITDEILEELSSTLQKVEAQSSAILEFLKEKCVVKEDELAPYLERASAASSVRWRATRVRLEKLLSGLEKKEQHEEQQKLDERKEAGQKKDQPKEETPKTEVEKSSGPKTTEEAQKVEPEKARESKPAAKREIEKPPADPLPPQSSDEKHDTPRPKQPAQANTEGDSSEKQRAGIASPRADSESTATTSTEKSPSKPKRPKAA